MNLKPMIESKVILFYAIDRFEEFNFKILNVLIEQN